MRLQVGRMLGAMKLESTPINTKVGARVGGDGDGDLLYWAELAAWTHGFGAARPDGPLSRWVTMAQTATSS